MGLIRLAWFFDFTMPILRANMNAPKVQQKQHHRTAHNEEDPSEKLALAWLHTARFLTTASRLDQLPVTELPEFAFVGRSNAGKSTAINILTQQGGLAFASKKPGRTQHINLFAVGPKDAPNALLADLPGYGYAAVAKGEKIRWQQVMTDYLEVRRSLTGVVLMADSRLGLTVLDLRLLELIAPRVISGSVKLLILLTKCDKLNRSDSTAIFHKVQYGLGEYATPESEVFVSLFSALKKTGLGDVAQTLHKWTANQPRTEQTQVEHKQETE
jgi:GTP-binding protein